MARIPDGPARPPLRWLLSVAMTSSLVVGGLGVLPSAHAETITVTTLADEWNTDPNTGCALREAIYSANTGVATGGCPAGSFPGPDTIVLGPGRHLLYIEQLPPNDDAKDGDLDVDSDITILGAGRDATIIDAVWSAFNVPQRDRVFHVLIEGSSLTAKDLTIRGGTANVLDKVAADAGGGIYVADGTLSLDNVVVTRNVANLDQAEGGGIFLRSSTTATLVDTYITQNIAGTGGGIYTEPDSTLTMTGGAIGGPPGAGGVPTRNEATKSGGAGAYIGGTATLTEVEISHNFSEGDGGGIYTGNGPTVSIDRSTIANNTAESDGGGIYGDGTLSVTNSTISGNAAGNSGGGLFFDGVTSTLEHVTVTRNVADDDRNDSGEGGGVGSAGSPITLRNSIVALNEDHTPPGAIVEMGPEITPDCSAPVTSQGRNLVGDTTECTGLSASDIIGKDPLLGPLSDNGGPTQTHALLAGSPAVDKAASPAIDQRGAPRPFGAGSDIGAYERFLCAGGVVNVLGTNASETIDVTGGLPKNIILGLAGNDRILAGPGADLACGGDGNDVINGGTGRDKLYGENGNDKIRGGGNPDELNGGAGNDALVGGGTLRDKGDDCIGGPGEDSERGCEITKTI